MSASDTLMSWICPACTRRVPMRVESCRCGAFRPLPPAPTATRAATSRLATAAPLARELSADPLAGLTAPALDAAPQATSSPVLGPSGRGFDETLRHPGETTRFYLMAAFATVFWAAVILSIFGIFYGLTFLVFSLVARALFLANLRGNGLLVSERQLPHIHAAVIKAAHRLGLETPPTAYVMQSEGSLNAFATKLISRNYIVIYSALIDACADQAQVDFVVAHEVGHLAAGHLKWMGFLAPARLLPWLGPAYSRACEYTCDRCGLAVVQDAAAADRGLLVLAAGSKASMQADVEYFMAQRLETGGFWSALVELGSSHPYLCKRVAALRDYEQPGSMAPVARNPLAYVFAPFASAGGVAGAGGGLLVMVAMMGIIAAIAIPSLLRARVAVNEATAIGDARDVIRAQASFKNMTGGYGSIECLAAPASCITGYPATGPVLLTAIQAAPQANGYERAIVHSDTDSFVYLSAPLSPSTGIRTFCADARGVVCSAPSAAEASAGTTCSRLCQPLR